MLDKPKYLCVAEIHVGMNFHQCGKGHHIHLQSYIGGMGGEASPHPRNTQLPPTKRKGKKERERERERERANGKVDVFGAMILSVITLRLTEHHRLKQ